MRMWKRLAEILRRSTECRYCDSPATHQIQLKDFEAQTCVEHTDRALDEYLDQKIDKLLEGRK